MTEVRVTCESCDYRPVRPSQRTSSTVQLRIEDNGQLTHWTASVTQLGDHSDFTRIVVALPDTLPDEFDDIALTCVVEEYFRSNVQECLKEGAGFELPKKVMAGLVAVFNPVNGSWGNPSLFTS